MSRIAVYPGSFDPITNGHLDIIERASKLFDKLIVAIAHNASKKSLFTLKERRELLEASLPKQDNIEVEVFPMLLVDFVRERKACAIVRGLRAVSDFDYEFAMYQVNAEMFPEVETVFLLASSAYSFLSSSILKELARHGRSLAKYTPAKVDYALRKKFHPIDHAHGNPNQS